MEATEVKKLKLNARRIHNTLLSNNKQLRKLRLSETSFLKNQETQEKRALKEQTIEKPSGVKRALTSIKDKLISGPMSIFDKIKELFGIILVGFLINTLPGLIKKLKKFFDENPGIINAIKETFKILGNLGYGLIQIVNSLTPKDQQKLTAERDEVNKGIDNLDSELNMIDRLMVNLFNVFGAPTPQPAQPAQPTASAFAQSGGYGRYPTPPQPQPQPQSNPLRPSVEPPPTVIPRPTPEETRGYAKGGTVQGFQGGGTVTKKKKVTSPGTFARPGGTAKGKKARESVNAFEDFETNTKTSSFLLNVQDENNKSFSKLTKNLSIFGDLIKGRKDGKEDERPPGGGPGGGQYPGEVSVSSDSADFWLLSTGALFENSDPQGASDVAQVIYNRVAASGDPWKTGGSIRKAILDPGQFTPVSGYGGPSEWGKIKDKNTAIAFVEKNGVPRSQLETIASALLDSSRQSSSRTFVGSRDSFRATTHENVKYDQLADDTEVSRIGHIFGFEPRGAQIGKFRQGKLQPAQVSVETRGTVTPTTPPPKPKGDIIPKEKTVVVEGSFRLRSDAAAAYLAMKADAKKAGVTIKLISAWRDSSVQAYLYDLFIRGLGNLAAPPGSSDHERGIAIDLSSGIPWAQKNCTKYGWYNSGMTFSQKEPWHFDYRGGYTPKKQSQISNLTLIGSIKNIMGEMNENEMNIDEYKLIIKDEKLTIQMPSGPMGLIPMDIEIEKQNLQLLKELESKLKTKQKQYGNLQSSTNDSSNVLLATVQQPYIVEREVVRYIGGNSGYISESGGNVNMEQLMALRLV
jgi:hypothetical protein